MMLKIDREAKNILLGGNAEMRNVTITTNDAPYVFDVDVNGVPALTEKNYQFML